MSNAMTKSRRKTCSFSAVKHQPDIWKNLKKKGEQQKKSFVELTLSFGIRHCSGEQSQGHTNNERRPASHEGKNKSPPPKNKNGE